MKAAPVLLVMALAGCGGNDPPPHAGDAKNGQLLLRQFGCGTCHRIPGVAAAVGTVGPPLEGITKRVYLAGTVPNTPANLESWIREPQRHKPGSAMPDMRVTQAQARDMAAYLQGLR